MKITLTKSELIAIVAAHFNLPEGVDVEVSGNDSIAGQLLNDFSSRGLIYSVDGGINPSEKINAIKRLRELVPDCGLVQAKLAVENWKTFTAYVAKNGFPRMGSDDPVVWR